MKVSVSDELKKFIYDKYIEYGYTYPAQLHAAILVEGFKSPRFNNPHMNDTKKFERYELIGNAARRVKARKFSVVGSVRDHKKNVRGIKEAFAAGIITKEERDEQIRLDKIDHQIVARVYLSGQKSPKEKVSSPKNKTKEEWDAIRAKIAADKKPAEQKQRGRHILGALFGLGKEKEVEEE